MKKSVIILIALIYVASVALVSFFGLQFKVFEEVIPVESVEITNDGLLYNSQWGDYYVIKPNSNGEYRYQINHRVFPENATNSEVDYNFTASPVGCATIDESGVVTFNKTGMVKIMVITKDGGDAQDSITLFAEMTGN